MTISFLVDPQHRLVRTTYAGVITLVDLACYVRELADRDLLKLAQLLDARHATLELSYEDTRIFAELMASLRSKHGCAQVAFVAGNAPSYRVAETYHELGAGASAYRSRPGSANATRASSRPKPPPSPPAAIATY